ncbi:MAG: metallophosphoesterase [Planctomycetota bacterium]
MRNAMDVRLNETSFAFSNLPAGFDNTRILLITDFHIDGTDGLAEIIITALGGIDYDFCILGGDYSFGYNDDRGSVCERMRAIAGELARKSRVFGILGNHDKYRIGQFLNECGVEMLANESVCLEKGSDKIYLAGLDDCHYYGADDIEIAEKDIPDDVFKIMVCHSPERYKEAADAGYSLYLAGHTHGGQVCLPHGVTVVTSTTAPRRLIKGRWEHDGMMGYTSRGVGASMVAVRYFCPPEITVVTLRCGG